MKREIIVSHAQKEHLRKIFNCSDRSIRNALTFDERQGNTDLTRRIRMAALKCGCEVMVTLREVETIHTADGVMEQRLPNGAVLKFYRNDGHGEIWHKGKLVERREDVTIREIYMMQERAMGLSKALIV